MTRFFEGALFGHGFVREGCTAFCCKCGMTRWYRGAPQGGATQCVRCGHVCCLGLYGKLLPGFGFLYEGGYFAHGQDVQNEPVEWNYHLRRTRDRTEWNCTCRKKIWLDASKVEEQLHEAGWCADGEGGWYCSAKCATELLLEREHDRPRRRLVWWRDVWGVNVWRIGHHLTAENLPSPYGRA